MSTSVSSLESLSVEVFHPSPDTHHQNTMDHLREEARIMKEEAKVLQGLRRRLVREMKEFPEEDICTHRITVMERDLNVIKEMKNVYQDAVEDFIDKFRERLEEDSSVLASWVNDVPAIAQEVRTHANKLRAKKESLFQNQHMSTHQRSLEIQEASLKLQELTLQEKKDSTAAKEKEKAAEDLVLAETEANFFLGECSVLGDIMADEDWEAADDDIVSGAMRNLTKCQEQMNTIERAYRKFENMATKHKFAEVKSEAIRVTYEDRKEKFEITRDAVRKEDTDRGLFTLEPARSDIMKYPTFSGSHSEDYMHFKETMAQRFRENKVRKKEQVAKLRECLKGAALGRVPDGVKDIEEAFRRLSEAFGNPNKVMTYNLKALEDLGFFPSEKQNNGKVNYARRIEWFLKLEVLDLSKRSSRLAHEAFASSTYRKLWARFPTSVLDKLVKVPGEDAERLEGILQKIIKMREHAQIMDDECGTTTVKKKAEGGTLPKMTVELFFRPAQRFDECRVCIHLSATSSSHLDLFENHLSNYPTGCPKFMEATIDLRKTIVHKIKICRQCFHPEVISSPSHMKECPFSNKKNSYSCLNKSCKDHMWICLSHKLENKKVMEKFRDDLQRKGHDLAMTIYVPLQANPTTAVELLSAVKKIRRVENKKGIEIVPVPEGEPMFLFHAAQGRTEPVNTFYDNGCSHAVFKDGIPGDQLRGQLVAKGPFNIGGVAGLTTKALDEWVVVVPRTDGKKQLIQGLTVPRVTSDFPLTNLEAAFEDIKNDDPSNATLQRCKVPPLAGGCVHMLLGIKYISVFPKEVHTLPCGLTIYKSRLASHGGKYNACIGGPHSSFTGLTGAAGGTAQLLTYFMEGLQAYRQWGPPRISYITMSDEEMCLARQFNCQEGETREFAELESMENLENEFTEEEVEVDYTCCSHCQEGGIANVQVAGDERIREFKRFQGIHESGLEVEYRCPKCRDCMDCKLSDKTEKISFKEESEMFKIKKSVTLDFENKKIQCSLPLRDKERTYLTNNRDRALKVLNQQLKKYNGDLKAKKIILEAFAKLFNNGHAKLLSDLSQEELDQFIQKEVQYHIPWRVVFSNSPTTTGRPVMDASSRTGFRKDGSGGKCLNDLVCRGKVESLNLLKVLLRFTIGLFALSGDLKQFYNACKLFAEQWNLQRFLWVENLDPDGAVLEAVIVTLIYGVTSVSAQSEFALSELAAFVKETDPELATFLILSRYVDDLQDSKSTEKECFKLAKAADELFEKVGLTCKGWNFSGLPPSPAITKDGLSVGVGGFGWFPEGDILELKVPKLHFGKLRRGSLADSVKVFEGTEEDIDNFVPDPLSRRQAASKLASLWDILGKLSPIMPGMKLDLRETFQRTGGWDEGMPADLRQRWVKNFWLMERLRGLRFSRAVMPADAIDSNFRVLTGVDAAKEALVMGCWGGFRLKNNSWSNQLLLGRSILAKNESIPKSELDAMCGGSNMAWVLRLALKEWVKEEIIFSDSMIALCWLTSEKLRLELFHRNRVLQIRRGTDLNNVYHVRTEANPADCGTRPAKVKLSDIGPDSRWENGDPWMKMDIEDAVSKGFIKPASELRVSKEMEDDFNKGLIFRDHDEILTRGHPTITANIVSETRVKKLQERAEYSNYLLVPTKYNFPATVRVYGYVMRFIQNASRGRKMLGHLLKEASLRFSVFSCDLLTAKVNSVKIITKTAEDMEVTKVLGHFTNKKLVFNNTENQDVCRLTDSCLHQALIYIFRKGAAEVKNFVSKKAVDKVAYEIDGVLLSKGRLLEGMNFVETGELGEMNIGSLGIKVKIPVLERYSPLSYSIAQHIHWTVGKHRGIETMNRLSLQHVSIMQAMTLYREIAEECIRCHMKRKKYCEVPMGPIAQEQLMIAPPFYVTMVDLYGPVQSYVPGFERHTRNRQVLETKLYVLVAVCITTRIVNLQAIEGKSAPAIIDGFTRLCCEVGIPSMVHVDQDTGALAGFQTAELDFRDLQHQLHTQFGISFSTCPVGGHNQHGLVESIIKSIQETFSDSGLKNKRIHATGWQTFCKLAENAFNNVPLGYSYSRYQDNTELLKILTPNMLRVGKINSRALQGPIRLPVNKKEMLEQVELTYQGWFKIFKETVVPRLIPQPKWFKLEKDLKEKDLVYFKKNDTPLSSTWTLGQVDQVIVSKDGLVRRAVIKYFNSGERYHQLTDRSARKMVKLWSINEACLSEDLGELQRRLDNVDEAAQHGHIGQTLASDRSGAVHGHDPASSAEAVRLCHLNCGVEGVQPEDGGDQAGQPLSTLPVSCPAVVYTSCSPVMSSVLGFCATAKTEADPPYITLDGCKVDLAVLSLSCDLIPLLIENSGLIVEESDMHEDDDNQPEAESDDDYQESENLDTLHKIMVSTGFVLE